MRLLNPPFVYPDEVFEDARLELDDNEGPPVFCVECGSEPAIELPISLECIKGVNIGDARRDEVCIVVMCPSGLDGLLLGYRDVQCLVQ